MAGELAQELVGALESVLGDLRPQSQAALQHALAVAAIEGIEGTLVIRISRKLDDPVEVSFVTGKARLTLEH